MHATINGWVVKYDEPGLNGIRFAPGCFHNNNDTFVPVIDDRKGALTIMPDNIVGYAELHEYDDGVYCSCYISDKNRAESFIRRITFCPPKMFTFQANRIEYQDMRSRRKVLHGVIRTIGIDYIEVPTSVIENISIIKENN